MGCVQAGGGLYLSCSWAVYELSADYAGLVRGRASMDCPRAAHGLGAGYPWTGRGLPVGYPWTARGL